MADKTRAERNPDGYAYRYHSQLGGTVLRFNHGEDVNGGRPFEVVPYWFSPPDLRAFVAEWVDRFGFLAKRNKPDDICAIDEVACIITDDMDDLHAKLAAAEERIAAIVEWTHQYGANLCPFGNYTDSFGDGMRAAKEQVSRIAELGKGGA